VMAKDPEAAKKLVGKIFDKLKATDLTRDQSAASFLFWFLDEEFKSRRQELTPGEKMYGVKHRKPTLSDQSLQEWGNFAGAIALSIISGATQNNGAPGDSGNLISDAIRLLPDMEKISPAVVANIRRKYAEVSQKLSASTRQLVEENDIYRNGKVEDFLALAEKAQGAERSNYLHRAIFKAVNSDADFDRARNIIDEKIAEPDERKREISFVEWVHAQYAAEQGKIEEAMASLAHLESDDERTQTLGYIIETALKAGNKKNAAQLLEKALGAMPPQIETSNQFAAMSRIIRGLAETDAERAFALYESLIDPINQIASAYIQMCRFDGPQYGVATKDEMLIQKGSNATQAILAFVEETTSLARSDFDRAMALAGRFRQTELRVYAELNAIQAVSSKR
jgi:tetratricopeptide (TPR) repeat protein